MARTIPRTFRRKRVAPGLYKPNPGSAPGLLRHNPLSDPTQINIIAYGPEGYTEQPFRNVEELEQLAASWSVLWVNVCGLADVELIEALGLHFNLDRMLLEDVLDTTHRPKVEMYEGYVFAILRNGILGEQFESEQISLFLKKNVVIAFQEHPANSFEQVRERIRRGTGKIRHHGTDYLFYALVDEVVDRYYPILDRINYQLTLVEEQMVVSEGYDQDIIQQIHHVKSDLLLLKRAVWPMTGVIDSLMREDGGFLTKQTRGYLRDCYDHSVQANELAQFYRDTATGLLNTFLAYEGYKTNEIVKVLTMVSAVFIPLNLIAGIYGMNFRHMPELEWMYGYPVVIGLMLLVVSVMLLFFRNKGWLGGNKRRRATAQENFSAPAAIK